MDDIKRNKIKIDRRDDTVEVIVHRRTQNIIVGIILLFITLGFALGATGQAGAFGSFLYHRVAETLLGFAAILLPLGSLGLGIFFLKNEKEIPAGKVAMMGLFGLALVTLLAVSFPAHEFKMTTGGGGIIGAFLSEPLIHFFGLYLAIILLALVLIGSFGLIFLRHDIPTILHGLFEKIRMFFARTHKKEITVPDEEPEPEEEEEEKPVSQKSQKAAIQEPANNDLSDMTINSFDTKKKPSRKTLISTTGILPPLSLLVQTQEKPEFGDIKATANLIQRTLSNFGINVEMDEVSVGPTVTRYALKPAEGVKLSRIEALEQDLALALAAHPLRIEAPIPGRSLVGIEVPNKGKATIRIASLLADEGFANPKFQLPVALGKGVTGKVHFANIAKMPHLLIAGATGSGKSVTVHNMIISLLYRHTPETLRFIFVDPKRVELTLYDKIPHLLTPVIKDPKKAILALRWAGKEMERRYDILEHNVVRDIHSYNEKIVKPAYENVDPNIDPTTLPEKLPYIVIIIDELADIMQAYPRELEAAIVRLAQMSRAVGIHLILSTQRPSVNVITGLIKANIPARLALQVSSQIDSRTILDTTGAESLLGAGDMLYIDGEMAKPTRIQCAFISEDEVKKVVAYLRKHTEDVFDELDLGDGPATSDKTIFDVGLGGDADDDMYEEAKRVVIEAGKASTSYIQRKLRVGYSRAARLMDLLEEKGVIGPADGAKPREVLVAGAPKPANDETIEESDE